MKQFSCNEGLWGLLWMSTGREIQSYSIICNLYSVKEQGNLFHRSVLATELMVDMVVILNMKIMVDLEFTLDVMILEGLMVTLVMRIMVDLTVILVISITSDECTVVYLKLSIHDHQIHHDCHVHS